MELSPEEYDTRFIGEKPLGWSHACPECYYDLLYIAGDNKYVCTNCGKLFPFDYIIMIYQDSLEQEE